MKLSIKFVLAVKNCTVPYKYLIAKVNNRLETFLARLFHRLLFLIIHKWYALLCRLNYIPAPLINIPNVIS